MAEEQMGAESQESISEATDTVKTGIQKVGKGAQKVGKAVGKVAKGAGKTAGKLLSNPLVWKILLIVGIVLFVVIFFVAIIVAIISIFTVPEYDPATGKISSMFGVKGDKFYGARFIYQDNEAANLEIKNDYLKLTYNILNDTKTQTGLSVQLSADYLSDEKVLEITTDYANALIQNTETQISLEQCVSKIEHFGFTDEQITIVFDSVANTLKENSWASQSAEAIKSALNTQYQTQNYAQYKFVAPKIYVWDCILENENDGLFDLPKKDFYGFVYMPKQNVTMESLSLMFVVDGGYGVDVCLKNKTTGQEPTALGELVNANTSWYFDNKMQEFYECEPNINLPTFEAIDTSNLSALSTPTSIYTLLSSGSYATYFTQSDDLSGSALIQSIASSNYIYLECDNKDSERDPFNVAEQLVNYA